MVKLRHKVFNLFNVQIHLCRLVSGQAALPNPVGSWCTAGYSFQLCTITPSIHVCLAAHATTNQEVCSHYLQKQVHLWCKCYQHDGRTTSCKQKEKIFKLGDRSAVSRSESTKTCINKDGGVPPEQARLLASPGQLHNAFPLTFGGGNRMKKSLLVKPSAKLRTVIQQPLTKVEIVFLPVSGQSCGQIITV